jgi:hypothetical protein
MRRVFSSALRNLNQKIQQNFRAPKNPLKYKRFLVSPKLGGGRKKLFASFLKKEEFLRGQ